MPYTYRGFEIENRYNWKTNRKQPSIFFGAGNSKTKGFFENRKIAKLFIDWIVESDYSRIDNERSRAAYWKYEEARPKR